MEYVSLPDGNVKQFHYEHTGFPRVLTGITDERGIRYATYEYYADGRAKASYHAGNAQRVDITYDDTNGTRTATNSRGHTTTYTTDVNLGAALVTSISGPGCSTCANGGDTSYTYDPANNNLLSKTENGLTTQYGDYDAKGQYGYKVEGVGTPEERRIEYDYDPRFYNKITEIREPSVYSSAQKITTRTYDDWGNRLTETINGYDPDGNTVSRTTRYEYNGPLRQLSLIDGPRTDVSDLTHYRYYPIDPAYGNNRGRLQEVENANGDLIRSNIQYTATGKVESETRPNGLQLGFTYYIGNDRLKTRTETDTFTGQIRTTRWTYLPTGEVETITQAYGTPAATTLTFDYDDARRLVRITDGLGNYIEYTLDTEGNRKAEKIYDDTGALKKQLTQTFDIYNQLDTSGQANESADHDYAPDGTLDRLTDGRNAVTDYSYDALRRLTRTVQDTGGSDPTTAAATTTYDYDAQDNLTAVTNPIDGTTTYAYDDLGNRVRQTSPDTGTTTFQYDAAGNLTQKTDAKGQVFTYSYDSLNRLKSIDGSGTAGDISYSYDTCQNGQGQLCGVSLGTKAVTYVYNSFGEVVTHQGISYTCDSAGRVESLTYPSGVLLTYVYDEAGNVVKVTLDDGNSTAVLADAIAYAPFGPLTTLTYGNGLILTQDYDAAYRLDEQTTSGVLERNYSVYDGNGNLETIDDLLVGMHSYSYDALDRLDTASGPFGTRDYDHDPNGNRTKLEADSVPTAYAYEHMSNRLDSIGDSDVIQDAAGNTVQSGVWSYTYTAHQRLATVSMDSNLKAAFTYNGLGQRAAKIQPNGTATLYAYATDGSLLAETDGAGRPLKEYIYLNGEPLAVIDHDRDSDGVPDEQDNCVDAPNGPLITDAGGHDQWDTNGDGYGNRCDGDLNDDGTVNTLDLNLYKLAHRRNPGDPNYNPDADFNGDGPINTLDFNIYKMQ